ncbi:MAG TPA: hypothetical protein VLZ10_07325 [Thermodesulfobacteriota bacterium]|nr:hypothetical protein [Thermodesulfobacteriota bacterium]
MNTNSFCPPNPFIYLMTRAISILRTEGPAHLVKRMKDRLFLKPLQMHCFVYMNKNCAELPLPRCDVEVELREMTAADSDEIDELTAVDEWHTSKSSILRRLEKGEHIYNAKLNGRIVTSVSIVTKDRFVDPVFKREFQIGPDEGFCWRGFSVPSFRGRGILPVVLRYYLNDMALKYRKSNALCIVRTINESSIRSISKIGWVKAGRVGFFEIFGIRFHYLWGREAFKETRRRFLIQNIG